MELPEYRERLDIDVLAAMRKPTRLYWIALGTTSSFVLIGLALWVYQIMTGMGVAGLANPVGWGVYITNFVFWIGIAHSGTLISAVLFLTRAKFRSSFNRSAEAMTIFALVVAGMFPLIHLGRAWLFYYLIPYPNQRQLWVNFRSPLVWDVFAVSTYFTVSVIFFYVGLVPDLAIVRRFSKGIRKAVYSVLSLGWEGSVSQWLHYNRLYFFLAAFATPLVVSVHSVVSWDFAMSILPGWHTTIFAPYFVAGAIFSGTAMVITLVVPMRKMFSLEKYITLDHFDDLAKILLFTSLIVTYAYIVEFGIAYYSGIIYEVRLFTYRAVGHYAPLFWLIVFCNCVVTLPLFAKKFRTNLTFLFIISIFVNIGMWVERFVIIVTSLAKDFDPYSWGTYVPSFVEIGITIMSFSIFFTLFLLFAKLLPVLAITDIKEQAG
ncbi:MAG: polysulfide reductase NrfD [Nitrospinae bacterium]|nr:polysulfide reductase NrfD [Nitrospinota bacterium]